MRLSVRTKLLGCAAAIVACAPATDGTSALLVAAATQLTGMSSSQTDLVAHFRLEAGQASVSSSSRMPVDAASVAVTRARAA